MNIIGLAGKAGSGKSTVANILTAKHSMVEIALADEVKRIVQCLYDFTDTQLWGPSEARNAPDERYSRAHGPWMRRDDGGGSQCVCCGAWWPGADPDGQCYLTPRFALQRLGTEFGRNCYENTWVDIALMNARAVLEDHVVYDRMVGATHHRDYVRRAGVVISDVRFPNELRAIRAAGGKVWRVERPGAGLAGAVGQHSSETSLDGMPDEDFDVIVLNDGDIAWLVRNVARILGAGPKEDF